jgi:hypothetical protein
MHPFNIQIQTASAFHDFIIALSFQKPKHLKNQNENESIDLQVFVATDVFRSYSFL